MFVLNLIMFCGFVSNLSNFYAETKINHEKFRASYVSFSDDFASYTFSYICQILKAIVQLTTKNGNMLNLHAVQYNLYCICFVFFCNHQYFSIIDKERFKRPTLSCDCLFIYSPVGNLILNLK